MSRSVRYLYNIFLKSTDVRKLRQRLALGVFLAFMFITADHLSSLTALNSAEDNIEAVNTIGVQRKLGQRVMYFATLYQHQKSAPHLASLETSIERFASNHQKLLSLNKVSAYLSDSRTGRLLERDINTFVEMARKIAEGGRQSAEAYEKLRKLDKNVLSNRLAFAVEDLKRTAVQDIEQKRVLQLSSYLFVVIILCLMTFLIFWPAYLLGLRIISRLERKSSVLSRARLDAVKRNQELETAKKEVMREKIRFDAFFNNADSIMYLKEADGTMLHVNDRFCSQFGLARDNVIGQIDSDIFGRHFADEWRQEDRKLIAEAKKIRVEEVFPNPGGSENYFVTIKFPIFDPSTNEDIICVLSTDVTSQKTVEKKIDNLVFFDELTQLPNRSCCKKDIIETLETASSDTNFACVHLDIDNFKRVNDTLGHAAGDALLKEIGRRLKILTEKDGKAYRWGGDEFIVLLDNKSDEALGLVCNEIADLLSVSLTYLDNEIWPTVSLGVARYPQDGKDLSSLLVYADLALFNSKQKGRDCYTFFTQSLKEKIDDETRIEKELRDALERDELFLVYQPQHDVSSLKVTGVEALIRWDHPERGVLSPGAFLDVVEQTKMAQQVGRFVFDSAFQSAKKWQDAGLDFGKIAVNLSSQHFKLGTLGDDFQHSLKTVGIAPEYVCAEVVESILLDDTNSEQIEVLKFLHDQGVSVELDDFGTGFASLTHLASLPIDGLKIDKSFTNRMLHQEKKAVLIKTLINMAAMLKLTCVCEGVETVEQLNELRRFGTCSVQGYLLARPMAFEKMTEWLESDPRQVLELETMKVA